MIGRRRVHWERTGRREYRLFGLSSGEEGTRRYGGNDLGTGRRGQRLLFGASNGEGCTL